VETWRFISLYGWTPLVDTADKRTETNVVDLSLTWSFDTYASCRHHSASEMTYIVSSGALNSTHSLTCRHHHHHRICSET